MKENSSTDVGVHFASFIGYYYRLDEGNSICFVGTLSSEVGIKGMNQQILSAVSFSQLSGNM